MIENNFIIQGDGKLTIKYDIRKNDMLESSGLIIPNSNFVIKENAKIKIIMNSLSDLKGLEMYYGSLYMKGNSQLSVYIKNEGDPTIGIECNGALLSDNITINSSILNLSPYKPYTSWFYPHFYIRMNNY